MKKLTADEVRGMRAEASDALERNANRGRVGPGADHIRMLTDPRDSKIVSLCDELLDHLETEDTSWPP